MKEQTTTADNEDETKVFQAKLYRLHGKVNVELSVLGIFLAKNNNLIANAN